MPFFDIFACPRWSLLRMRIKVVSFFIFSKSFQTKKIKTLRSKMTKRASRGSCLNFRPALEQSRVSPDPSVCQPYPSLPEVRLTAPTRSICHPAILHGIHPPKARMLKLSLVWVALFSGNGPIAQYSGAILNGYRYRCTCATGTRS